MARPITSVVPNRWQGFHRETYRTYVVEVLEQATAIFKGTVVGKEVRNAAALFRNGGTLK